MSDTYKINQPKASLEAVDIAKFIASVLIFSRHCHVILGFNNLWLTEFLSHWGVPFFFICSSYFLFSKSKNGQLGSAVRKYISRIGALYAVWFIYNLPNVFFVRLYPENLAEITTWLGFIKNSILSSTFTGSWYLASSIFSAFLIYGLSKKFSTKIILCFTFVFYLFCVFSSAYGNFSPSLTKVLRMFCFPLNIFNGLFYFAVGKYICENKEKIEKVFTQKKALLCFFVFYLLYGLEIQLAEYFKFYSWPDVAFCTVLMSSSLFLFCMQAKVHIEKSLLLRKLSIIIFCCQGNVLLVNSFCKKMLGYSAMISYFISMFIIAVICVFVLYMQKRSSAKWVQALT